ncbi:uncharacterized protein LOC117322749 isoform X2 [Pecten maximus]|uniref:uncharacterized protein LOC117322749 isoform X2 n=1 Tax=Pecten maximus TaxID=6579 RepID=UPI0014589904|nr:uncharacterized protein LOC117322749 isoform X2 [Pecten maximus]
MNAKSEVKLKLFNKFCELRKEGIDRGLDPDVIHAIFQGKTVQVRIEPWVNRVLWGLAIVIAVLSIFLGGLAYHYDFKEEIVMALKHSRCIIDNNGFVIEITRPKTNCQICENLLSVPMETNISTEEFIRKYAYTAVPVLVKDATRLWTAMDTFSFRFFRDLYKSVNGSLDAVEEECQFFPYKTEFETLEDVLNMTEDRADFKEGEKHWSNCHPGVSSVLREHYQKPYFLPNDSESSALDWIFMGGTGLGAFIHLDYVQRPSWQAQISGKKTWSLIPTPECEHLCHSMNITVQKGDIIVVDTNQWYHSTYIHPGEISITIGSEYD